MDSEHIGRSPIEMSRYIDLDMYHKAERSHAFYVEMIDVILDVMKRHFGNGDGRLLELGAGTGLATIELLKIPNIMVDALEYDSECGKILKKNVASERCNIISGDAVTYCREGFYDGCVSVFAHDHIHYDRRFDLSKNIRNNLKDKGIYIMGGEILAHYRTEEDRKEALKRYHGYIIDRARDDKNDIVVELETQALMSGLNQVGDFKRNEVMFEEEMESSGLKLVTKTKIGPVDIPDIGGVFVYVYQR